MAAPTVVLGSDERAEIALSILLPSEKNATWTLTAERKELRTAGVGVSQSTRLAPSLRQVRLQGVLRKYRVFDETADFGVVPLRAKKTPGGSFPGNKEPALTRPRAASTPSGLRLLLPVRSSLDRVQYGFSNLTVLLRAEYDPSTVLRGLPSGLQKLTQPIEVTVGKAQTDWPSYRIPSVGDRPGKQDIVLQDMGSQAARSVRLRLKVRRRVLLSETPFNLVLPIAPKPENHRTNHGSSSSFSVDARTLRPEYVVPDAKNPIRKRHSQAPQRKA